MDAVAIVVDAQRFVAVYQEVTSLVRSAGAFYALPILTARPDDPGIGTASHVPGVTGITPLDTLHYSLLVGIDQAAVLTRGYIAEGAVGGVNAGTAYPYAYGEPEGSAAPPANWAAVNISLTPPNDSLASTNPADPVNAATYILSGATVPTVAAGNRHFEGAQFETVSPWAEPDWVLGVGATADEEGTTEWERSARGSANLPGVGPDVLAWGQDPYDANQFGTSFAAPRVAFMVLVARAWLLQVAANVDRHAGRPFGVPLVGAAVLDRGFPPGPPPAAAFDWPAMPVIASRRDPFGDVLTPSDAERFARDMGGHPGVVLSRRLIEAAAQATTPPGTRLSAPSLGPARLTSYLDGLSAASLLELAGLRGPATPEAPPIFETGTGERVRLYVASSAPRWEWDVDAMRSTVAKYEEGRS